MKKRFLCWIALLSCGCLFHMMACEDPSLRMQKRDLSFSHVAAVEVGPLPLLFNWSSEICEYWDSGVPKEILFVSVDGWPMKKLLYYPSGLVFQEIDFADSSFGEEGKNKKHGAVWTYHENGALMRTEMWDKGVKTGKQRTFSDEGLQLEECSYRSNLLDGSCFCYFPSGRVREHVEYVEGIRQGSHELFFEDGTKQYEAQYHKGLLIGRSMEWWESGIVKKVCFWTNGLLHTVHDHAALSCYNTAGKLVEQQHFVGGVAHGPHRRWHENGALEMTVHWNKGKKEGFQEYYTNEGVHSGHREFVDGLPSGQHWNKDAKGVFLLKADFTSPGHGEMHLFDSASTERMAYHMDEGCLSGEFLEWDENGHMKKRLHYERDMFHGVQQGFSNNGACRFSFEYSHGQRNGLQEEWFPNGQKSARVVFIQGVPDGLFELWYINGAKRIQETYKMGVFDGSFFSWHENGEKGLFETWEQGKKIAKAYMWNEQGALIKQEEWDSDLPHGLWKEWYDSGQQKSESMYVHGVLEGRDIEWSDEGVVIQLQFWKAGKRDGLVEQWYEDGTLRFKGSFVEGKPEGLHETMYEKTSKEDRQVLKQEERFVHGKLHGKQVAYYPNGVIKLEVLYANGVLNGAKKAFHENGDLILSAQYREGRLEGEVFHKRLDGLEEVQCYKDNHPDGVWRLYYPEHPLFGRVKALEASFSKGLLQGEYLEYNQAGQLSFSVFYDKGLQEGVASMYSMDGRVLMTAAFHLGELDGPFRCFYPSGSLRKEGTYVHNHVEGEERCFHENGTLAQRSFYQHGKLNGPICAWNSKKQPVFEGEYKEGLRSGLFKKYDEKGVLRVVQKFDNDVLVERNEVNAH